MRLHRFHGLFERRDSGLLVPTRKVLVPRPAAPKKVVGDANVKAAKRHISGRDGKVTDVTNSHLEYAYDAALAHYEARTGRSLTRYKSARRKLRDLVYRAGSEAVKG